MSSLVFLILMSATSTSCWTIYTYSKDQSQVDEYLRTNLTSSLGSKPITLLPKHFYPKIM